MKNSTPHFTSFAQAMVSTFGSSVAIERTEKLTGGDINKSYCLTLNSGEKVFMKTNEKEKSDMFSKEALSLEAIKATGTIGTPEVLCTGTDNGEFVGYSFLLLKFVESKDKRTDYWETFARDLSALHKADAGNQFGFSSDNYIGLTPQKNSYTKKWIPFFRDMRLEPMFRLCDSHFTDSDRAKHTKLLDNLEKFLVEPEKPSLLHGDLWNGNVMCGSDGKAILIDPASYAGHREADLAMTELFGGFPEEFYAAYKEVSPLQENYEERRDLYNLYHILNHLHLFGEQYLEAVRSIVDEYVA